MDVTLGDIERVSPEAANRVRDAIRHGLLPADRQPGVAGRPYLVSTDDLTNWDAGLGQVVAHLMNEDERPAEPMVPSVDRTGAPSDRRRAPRRWQGATPPVAAGRRGYADDVAADYVGRMVSLMEAQAAMMRTLVDGLNRANSEREDRLDKMQEELQQMSYKLGQAHQEIGRLERHLAERQGLLSRAGEA
jgi:uncharacterized coiled-coil protein SlyX